MTFLSDVRRFQRNGMSWLWTEAIGKISTYLGKSLGHRTYLSVFAYSKALVTLYACIEQICSELNGYCVVPYTCSFQRDVTYDVVSYIAQRCGGFLRRISLRGCQNVPDQALSVFAQYCHNIEQVCCPTSLPTEKYFTRRYTVHCYISF